MSDIQDLIHRNAQLAYLQGEARERERIIKLFTKKADILDEMRPESYKGVADKADLRIKTIRAMVRMLEADNEDY